MTFSRAVTVTVSSLLLGSASAHAETRHIATVADGSVAPQAVATNGPHAPDEDLDGLTPEAQAEYERKFLQIGDVLVVSSHKAPDGTGWHESVNLSYEIYRGKYRARLAENDFFHQVGREDLAAKYETRRNWQYALFIGGLAVALGTTTYALSSGIGCASGPDRSADCSTPMTVGLVGGTVGIAMFVSALLINRHPVPPDELRQMADQYNQGLRRRLTTPPAPNGGSETTRSIFLAPYAGAQGGGLALTGRF